MIMALFGFQIKKFINIINIINIVTWEYSD